jgi:hypothetical protein
MSQVGHRGGAPASSGRRTGRPASGAGAARRIGRMTGTLPADHRHRGEPACDHSSARTAVGVFPRFGAGLRTTCRPGEDTFDDAEDMMPDRSPDARPRSDHGRAVGPSPRGLRAGW